MLNLKQNEEFQFDLEQDSVILINKMIKESIDSNLIDFKIQLKPGLLAVSHNVEEFI